MSFQNPLSFCDMNTVSSYHQKWTGFKNINNNLCEGGRIVRIRFILLQKLNLYQAIKLWKYLRESRNLFEVEGLHWRCLQRRRACWVLLATATLQPHFIDNDDPPGQTGTNLALLSFQLSFDGLLSFRIGGNLEINERTIGKIWVTELVCTPYQRSIKFGYLGFFLITCSIFLYIDSTVEFLIC